MGTRFRKSMNFGLFRINFSKSGVGYSFGGKGFRWTKKANGGTRTTMSIPGTGISHVTETKSRKATKTKKKNSIPTTVVLVIVALFFLLMSFNIEKTSSAVICRIITVAILLVCFRKQIFRGGKAPIPVSEAIPEPLPTDDVQPEPIADAEPAVVEPQPVDDTKDLDKRVAEKRRLHQQMLNEIEPYEIHVSEKLAPKLTISILNETKYSTITKRTSLKGIGDFVVIDTETTGLSVTSCEIVEIAAIRFRGFKPVCRFSMLLSTKKPIPQEATEINGITDEMVAGQPHFRQISASLLEFIGDDNLVGHNLEFDLRFIVKNGVDVTLSKRKYYDTLEIAQKTLKKIKYKWDKEFEEYVPNYDGDYDVEDYKLDTLCGFYGIPNLSSHRAEGDAIATGLLFEKLARQRIDT